MREGFSELTPRPAAPDGTSERPTRTQGDVSSRTPTAGRNGLAMAARSRWVRRRIYSELPPGPALPTVLQTLLAWRHTAGFLAAARRRYGPIYTLRIMPWGRVVVIAGAHSIKQVFTGDPATFHAGEANAMLAPVLGAHSVLVLDEDEHLQARERLLPAFHADAVRGYEQIVERSVIEEIERWPIGKPFPLHPRMRAITLEVTLKAIIGVSDPERLAALREVLPASTSVTPAIMAMGAFPTLGRVGRVGRWRRYQDTLAHANSLLRTEIAERRHDPELAERNDVLSALVRAGESDDEELRDHIMTLLLAGHETSATGMAWIFERLLRHPEIHARARLGEDAYLDAVVQETLRVRPVIPAVLRQLRTPVSLGDHYLPAGITVMPAIALMHNDFREPERFTPERFLEDNGASTYTWTPFGGGRRRCLGAAFASSEMRVALRTILERTALRADRPASEKIRDHHIRLVPARGARVVREA